MRKADLLILGFLVAAGASVLRPTSTDSGSTAASTTPTVAATAAPALVTGSGRWEVLPCPLQLAGLGMGMGPEEIEARLGRPTEKRQENHETSTWTYRSDGADLHLTLLEGRLISVGGNGRWALTEEGRPRPGFQSTEEEVRSAFGPPQRRVSSAWVYRARPGELTFHFAQGRVSQVWIATEIKGRPVDASASPGHN